MKTAKTVTCYQKKNWCKHFQYSSKMGRKQKKCLYVHMSIVGIRSPIQSLTLIHLTISCSLFFNSSFPFHEMALAEMECGNHAFRWNVCFYEVQSELWKPMVMFIGSNKALFVLWRALLWHTAVPSCKTENGLCTQAELQAIASHSGFCTYFLTAKKVWERMWYKVHRRASIVVLSVTMKLMLFFGIWDKCTCRKCDV